MENLTLYLQLIYNMMKRHKRVQMVGMFVLGLVLLIVLIHRRLPISESETNDWAFGNFRAANQVPRRQLLFLKVHRSGSSTMQNIMFRFAVRHNLSVWLPADGYEHFSEYETNWWRSAGPVPPAKHRHDIAFNHMIYSPAIISHFLSPNASRVAIVREPFQRFCSAFHYYRKVFRLEYLTRISGAAPVYTYLADQQKWEHSIPIKSQTNNRMSLDFGLEPDSLRNETAIKELLKSVERDFGLVMVMEMFDESLVLLKRTLSWSMEDILYVRQPSLYLPFQNVFSQSQVADFAKNQVADDMLYQYFRTLFLKKIQALGAEFEEEVATFRRLVFRLREWCQKSRARRLVFEATPWNEQFVVRLRDCLLMAVDERGMMSLLRHVQSNTTKHVGAVSSLGTMTFMRLAGQGKGHATF